MDDLKRKRKQNVNKMNEIIDNVSDNFKKSIAQDNLKKLYERKALLNEKMLTPNLSSAQQSNYFKQLKDILKQIKTIEESGVTLEDTYDTEVNEQEAKDFLVDKGILSQEELDAMTRANDILDELERTLGLEDGDK